MYLEHFGLTVNPFGLSPKLDFLYKSETFEESMAHLIYGLDNQEAIVLITGAIGTGKTMALQSFLTNLGPRFEFALVANTRVTPLELLKLILEDLGVKLPMGADKSDVLILFKDFLLEASRQDKMVLIVIDEAQNLATDVLEEIRLLTNLGQGESQPVQIILVGQPELEAAVNRPDLAQLRQRIRIHYRLDPLTRFECEEYIHHRMRVAGCHRQVFTSEAIDRIYEHSQGVPRLVNTLAGEALLSAFVAGSGSVQAGDVEIDRELSFETGPVPAADDSRTGPAAPPPPDLVAPPPAAPAAAVASTPPPPPPAPEPRPKRPAALKQRPEPAPAAVAIPRRRRGMSLPARVGMVAAVLVLFAGGLYLTGYLDELLARYQNPVSDFEVAAEQVRELPASIPDKKTEENAPEMEEPVQEQEPAAAAPEKSQPDPDPDAARATAAVTPPAENTAPVRIPDNVVTDTIEENIYIHVSSFRTPERARSLVRRLDGQGPGALYLKRDVRGTDWYRVYLGPYGNAEDAYHDALKLKQDGTISFFRITQIDPNDRI